MFRRLAFSLASALVLALLTFAAAPVRGANLLLVVADNAALTSEESARKTSFEGWGHTVTLIDESDSQANFDTALASADVVYVHTLIEYGQIGYKLRTTTVGVVHERVSRFDNYMGWSTSLGGTGGSGTVIDIDDTSHPITAGLSSPLTIFNSSSDSGISAISSTVASGAQLLGSESGNSDPMLAVLDTGATLANTYSGNSTASGRRVRLPYANFGFFGAVWSNLSTDGLQLVSDSLDWASAGASGSGSPTLVGHWRLDETTGTTAYDSSGNGNDATYYGGYTLGQPGPISEAVEFDGSSGHVSVPGSASLNLQDSITVSCWAKSDTATWNSTGMLVSKRNQFVLHPANGTTTMEFIVYANGSWRYLSFNVGSIDEWRHYAGVYNRSTGEMSLYVDGALAATQTIAANASIPSDTGPIQIGNDDGVGSRYFNGSMADVRVHDGALTDADIANLARKSDLLLHWKLDETSGTVAADNSGNGNPGMHGGSPGFASGVYTGPAPIKWLAWRGFERGSLGSSRRGVACF